MLILEQKLLLACLPVAPDHRQLSNLIKQNPDWDELFKLGEDHAVLPLIYQTLKSCPDLLVTASVLKRFQSQFAAHALQGGKEGRLECEETLVMLCAHGTKHYWEQLKWLVDIDRLVRRGPSINWQRAFALARNSGSLRTMLLGLSLVRSLLATPLCDEVAAKIAADDVVQSLAEDVMVNLFPLDPERKQYLHEYSFYLKSRDNLVDRLRQILRWLFWPRRADWQVFRLGDCCHGLFYVQRPVRMVCKWLLKPIVRR